MASQAFYENERVTPWSYNGYTIMTGGEIRFMIASLGFEKLEIESGFCGFVTYV